MTVRRAILPAVLPLALLAPSWWPAPGRPPPPRALQPDRHQAGHRARDGHVRLALREEAAAIDGAGLLLLSIDTRWQTAFSKEFAPARVLAKDLRRGRVPRRPATGWLSGAYLSNPTGIRRLLDRARSCAIGFGQPMGTRPEGLAGPRRIDEARGRDGGLGQSG